jgi:hypothetical protein
MEFLPSLSRDLYPTTVSEHIATIINKCIDAIGEHGSQMKDQLYEFKDKLV